MNFGHLASSALDQELGTDDSTNLFTTARRQRAINRGHLEFADLTECAIRQSTVTCSNGVREYNLLSTVNVPGGDFLRLAAQGPEYHLISSGSSASTTFQAGPDFLRRDIAWLNSYQPAWRSSTGATPESYYERPDGGARFFGLNPPPRITSSETGKVILPYVAQPSSMTVSTDVPFTFTNTTNVSPVRTDLEPYHQALVHYAASELEKLRKNYQGSQTQMQFFLGYVARYRQAQLPKGGQQVKTARNYFTDARGRRNSEDEQVVPYPWRQT